MRNSFFYGFFFFFAKERFKRQKMASTLKYVLGLLVVLCACLMAIAQDPLVVTEPLDNEVFEQLTASSPDIATSYVFPRYADKKFPSGEHIELLLGFANQGDQRFNVTSISASFNFPLDFSYFIQNFTTIPYNVFVDPGTQVSIAYYFMPDALLEPRDFGLVASVHYRDSEGLNYTTVFFNSTVDITEPVGGVDGQLFFAYVAIFVAVCGAGFFAYRWLITRSKKKASAQREYGTKAQQLDDDWLTGTSADPSLKANKKKPNNNNNKADNKKPTKKDQ
eukprot:TRINITY_DN15606_c0_g1_i1.p1 TRINITY_DN15606_c0_g1~~TRINITY_DN15606_c0_g1_i1.p1  ORF type:complete len:278 (-),score=58.06 TRINITY_DN15606_c0_g1_i1:12-845(-)